MPLLKSVVALVATIAAGTSAVAVPVASAATSSAQAERAALAALRARAEPLIVFRGGLLQAGTRVAAAGQLRLAAPKASSAASRDREALLRAAEVQVVRAPVVARLGRERAWFFYADEAPYQAWQHPGRVVLVGAQSGRVTVSKTLQWPPLLNGRLPWFLRSYAGYRSPRGRVFARLWRAGRAAAGTSDPLTPSSDPLPAAGAQATAAQLAAERSCVARVGDTLGNFYDANAFDQTRAGVGAFFNALARLDGGFVSARYRVASGSSLRRWVARLIDQRGCRDVLLYLAGGGYVNGGEPAVNVGIQGRADGSVEQQVITASLLRAIVTEHPAVTFKLQLDAPGSGALQARLDDLPNLILFLASSKRGAGSFTALPDLAASGGGTLRNSYNAAGLLEFSNRGLRGLRCFVADPAEVARAAADKAAGRSRSFLAAMLWRAYQLCGDGSLLDVVAPSGAEPPVARLVTPTPAPPAPRPPAPTPPAPDPPTTPPTGPPAPQNTAPTAAPVAVDGDEDEPVSFTLAGADADGDSLTYALVAQPAHGTVSGGDGAARTFTPDANWHGTTSFDYTVSDGRGGTATATVTIAIAPVADLPVLDAGSGPLTWTEGDSSLTLAPALTLSEADGDEIVGVEITISAGYEQDADRLDALVQNTWESTGTLRLAGPGTPAELQAALRTVTFTNTSNHPSTAPRTITFTAVDSGGDRSAPVTRALTVVSVNSPPTLTGVSATTLPFSEGDAPLEIAPAAAIGDDDDPRLAGVTVAIGSGFAAGEDELAATDSGDVSSSYDAATGLLSLTGDATPAEYQTVLRTVTYGNDSEDPSSADRTLTITVDDGSGGGVAQQLTVAVTPVDDPPVLTTSGGTTAFTGSPVAVDPGLTVSDVDDTELTGATVTIAAGHTAADVLAVTNTSAITGSYDAGAGVLTLTGTASVADYQALLRSVSFGRSPLVAGARTISFAAANGSTSNTATKALSLSAAPVVTLPGGGLAYTEGDGPRTLDAAATIADSDSARLAAVTVAIGAGYQPGADVLAATVSGTAISATFDTASGRLTLSGDDSPASYQRVLRTVTFRNSSLAPSTATRTVSVEADDGALRGSATTTVTVTSVDNPPIVTTTGGAVEYVENDAGGVVIDTGLTISDVDSASMSGATVTIGANHVIADELLFTNQNGIVGSFDTAAGVLTLTGSASVANYQAALRSVRFRTVGDDPSTATRTIAFIAADGTSGSVAATKNVTVRAVDDAPAIVSGATLAYTENDAATAIDPALTVSDPDNARLAGATVSIDGGFAGGEDLLSFVPGNGITGSWNNATGVLTLNGSATLAAYQAALRSVAYRNSSENPSTADRTIVFTVDDGTSTASDDAIVSVTAVDDAPSAAAIATDTVGNTRLAYGSARPSGRAARVVGGRTVLDDVTDVDTAGPFAAVAETVASANGGSATIAADGSFDYTPPVGFTGSDSFTARVAATSAPSVTGTRTVNVTVAGKVWYVDNSAPAAGTGRSQDPFDTLAEATAASAAGDTIYLFAGDGSANGTSGTTTLKRDQRLLGERAALVVGGTTLYVGDSAKRPQLADSVVLGRGTLVRGLRSNGGIVALSVEGGTLDDLVVTTAAAADAIELGTVTGSWRLSDLDVSNANGDGIGVLDSAGATIDFDSASTIAVTAGGGGSALEISGATLSGQIDSLTSTGTAGTKAAVSIIRTGGSLTLDDLNLRTAGTSGVGLLLDDSAGVVVNGSGDAAIDAAGQAVALRTSTNVPAAAVQPRVSLSTVRAAGGAYGVELNDVGNATFSAGAGSLAGQTTAAFGIVGGNGDVVYNGTIGDGSGDSVVIRGRSGGAVSFGGAISDSADVGGGIVATGSSGGSLTVSGRTALSTATRPAVDVSFSGGGSAVFGTAGVNSSLVLATTTADAFRATSADGSGSVTVTGDGNSARSTNGGAAVRIDGPALAGVGAAFGSLASSGAVSGVVLRDTGSAAGLTVSGDGTPGSAGTLASSTGPGVDMRAAKATLANLTITGGGDDGIRAGGSTVTLTTDTITNNGDAAGESAIDLTEPVALNELTDLTVGGSGYRGLAVSGTRGSATIAVTRGTWSGSRPATGDDTFNFDASGTAQLTAQLNLVRSTDAVGDHVQVTSAASAQSSASVMVGGSTFTNTPGNPGGGLTFNPGGSARLRAIVANNTISGAALEAITFTTPGSDASPQPVTIDAQVIGNTIGRGGVAGSGASNGNGIGIRATGGATVRASLASNQIRQYSNTAGIRLQQSDSGGSLDATVTGNTLAEPWSANALYGLYATAGSGSGTDNGTLCLDLRTNTMIGSGQSAQGGFDVNVRRRDQTTVRLPGYTGTAADATQLSQFLSANNGGVGVSVGSGAGITGGGAPNCAGPQ